MSFEAGSENEIVSATPTTDALNPPPGPTPMPLTLMALKLFSNVLNRSIGQNVQLHHLNNCAMGHSCVSHKFYSVQNFISPMKVFMYLPTFDQGLML